MHASKQTCQKHVQHKWNYNCAYMWQQGSFDPLRNEHFKSLQRGLNIKLDNSIIAANSTAPDELSLLPFYSPFGFALKCLPLNWRWFKCFFFFLDRCVDTACKRKLGVREQPEIIKSKQLKAKTCWRRGAEGSRSGVRAAGSGDVLWNRDRAQRAHTRTETSRGRAKWGGRSWEGDGAIYNVRSLESEGIKVTTENRRCEGKSAVETPQVRGRAATRTGA